MKYRDKIKLLASSDEIKEATKSFLEDAAAAILGDPVAAVRILNSLRKGPAFIQQEWFMTKLNAFLGGLDLDEEDIRKLGEKLEENGDKNDNAIRIISCIDRADTIQKIGCYINATKSLVGGFIDREKYFRICQAISNTLLEDLKYLKKHIGFEKTSYNESVQGLFSSGLMYMSSIQENPEYSFTPLATDVDRYSLSYGDTERYPQEARLPEGTVKLAVSPHGITWEELKGNTYGGLYETK